MGEVDNAGLDHNIVLYMQEQAKRMVTGEKKELVTASKSRGTMR